jgi:hypothetical protein
MRQRVEKKKSPRELLEERERREKREREREREREGTFECSGSR